MSGKSFYDTLVDQDISILIITIASIERLKINVEILDKIFRMPDLIKLLECELRNIYIFLIMMDSLDISSI